MTDLDERFEAYVFAPKRERIVQKWRVIQCQFVTLFLINGITLQWELLFQRAGFEQKAMPMQPGHFGVYHYQLI